MSSDDDTFLSAYLDGELESDQQHQVDSALIARPELAERLRALSVVRDLVVGLPREAGTDVSSIVMTRLLARPGSRSRFASLTVRMPQSRRSRMAIAGMAAVAASIVVAVAFTAARHRVRDLGHVPDRQLDNRIVDVKLDERGGAANDAVPSVVFEPRSAADSAVAIQSVSLNKGEVSHQDARGASDLELSREFLDNPHRRRLFTIKNGADGRAEQHVASVVEHTTQFGFFKITVSRGIVIDPRHPEEATVFALLVSPTELDRLRDQLKIAMPDAIEESSPAPAIVTQLADIGQVRRLSPAPLGEVSISRESLALQTRVADRADNGSKDASSSGQTGLGQPTAEQFRSAPLPTHAQAGAPGVPDHGTNLAEATDDSHPRNVTVAAGGTHSEVPIKGAVVALAKSDSSPGGSAHAKPEDKILVFVWVYNARAS